MAPGVLVLLGSGETAPGMTKVHREVFARLGEIRAVNLDTPYGFQLNVPQMSEKLEGYFDTSLHVALTTLHFASFSRASELERELFKSQVRAANYVFAGPGSPTYALSQWAPLRFDDDLAAVLDADGTICFASAAALTLGSFTAPIYEAYKVGTEDLRWRDGLDVLGAFDLRCAVIPHFDNAEGGNYDTRFCYLGEPRLNALEAQLPDGVAVLGVDEHTALILDRHDDTVSVRGRANGYWRLNGDQRVLENGSTTSLAELRGFAPAPTRPAPQPDGSSELTPLELAAIVEEGGEAGRRALVSLVKLATAGSDGHVDPAPLVEAILAVRRGARAKGQYEIADELRNSLVGSGFDVQDTPSGSTWSLRVD